MDGGREERGAEGGGVHASVAYVSAMQPGVPPSHVYVNALKDLFYFFFWFNWQKSVTAP